MPNGEDKGTGVGAGAAGLHLQAPRLQSGGIGYAAWRTNMDVFLQRAGAEGIHRPTQVVHTFHHIDAQTTSSMISHPGKNP